MFDFIINCIIGWIELLDNVPIFEGFSALDFILSFTLFLIIISFFFLHRKD